MKQFNFIIESLYGQRGLKLAKDSVRTDLEFISAFPFLNPIKNWKINNSKGKNKIRFLRNELLNAIKNSNENYTLKNYDPYFNILKKKFLSNYATQNI